MTSFVCSYDGIARKLKLFPTFFNSLKANKYMTQNPSKWVPENAVVIVGGNSRHHSKEMKREKQQRERRRMTKGNPDVGVMNEHK